MNFFKKIFSVNVIDWMFLLWFCIVYFSYLYFHDGIKIFIFNIILLGGFYFFYELVFKRLKIYFSWSGEVPLWIATILFFLSIFFILCFLNIFYAHNGNVSFSWLIGLCTPLFTMLFTRALFLSVFFVLAFSLGRKTLNWLGFLFDNILEEYIFSFAVGTMAFLFIFFFLGIFGLLYFWCILSVLVICCFVSRKEIAIVVRKFISQKIVIKISDNFTDTHNIMVWGLIFILIFFIITFIQTFYLIPTEYDDLDTYYSVPLMFAHYHSVVPFYNSISAIAGGIVMPLYAVIDIILSPEYNFSFAWMFFWLSMLTLYVFTKNFFSQKVAFITLLLAAFVPLNVNFINSQKIDFILVFYSILTIFCIFKWIQNKDPKWLFLSAIFLSLTINIKMSGLFLALSIFIFLSIFLLAKKIPIKHFIVCFFLVFVFLIPLLSYNIYYYDNPVAPFRFRAFSQGNEKVFASNNRVTLYDIYSKTDYIFKNPDDITALTRQNTISNSRIINFFWMLWNITVNQRGFNYIYSETGPFILIFFPFFVLYFLRRKYFNDKNVVLLLGLASLYFVIWYLKGYERVWYALPIFYLAFIFCALYLKKIENRTLSVIFFILIAVFSARSLFFSLFFSDSQPHIINTVNIASPSMTKFPQSQTLLALYEYINKNIIGKNGNALILMVPESRTGMIQQWDKHIIADHWGMYWSYLLGEKYTQEEIKDIFIQQGITYIFFSDSFYSWIKSFADKDNKEYAIIKNIEMLDGFKNTYLTKNRCFEEYDCIYEIKK